MALRMLYRHPLRYKDILEHFIDEANSNTNVHKQLCAFSQFEQLKTSAIVHQSKSCARRDLLYQEVPTNSADREELVVTLQGYVLRCHLPPITRQDQIPKNPVAAKQSIVVTGLGSEGFELSARAVLQIHTLFGTTLPEDTLLPWKPIRDSGYMCLEFSNRYFKGKDDGDATVLPLGRDIDPYELLRSKCPNAEHTEDNVVLYYERQKDPVSGNKKYTPCDPVAIKVGQLVEIQASFCIVPVSKGKHIMLNKLRAVCVLSTQVQDDLNDEIFNCTKNIPMSPTKKTKRNVGYTTQEDFKMSESTRIDLKRMRIDESDPK